MIFNKKTIFKILFLLGYLPCSSQKNTFKDTIKTSGQVEFLLDYFSYDPCQIGKSTQLNLLNIL